MGVLTALLGLTFFAAPAAATPVPSFTATPGPDPLSVSLNASASFCQFAPCSFNWRELNATRLGRQLGTGRFLIARFTTPGWKHIELRMNERTFRNPTLPVAFAYRDVFVT